MDTISSLQKKIAEGSATAESLTQEALSKINANQGNSVISVLNEQALERAAKLDAQRADGKQNGFLDGIPLALKDNICLKDAKTTCGSKMLSEFVAPYNATVTNKLFDQGAVIVAKANMDEFAMGSSNETSFFGHVINPQNPELIPGGSSGGSAAAVASGIVPASLGSDTGGSIRQPAACCGIVGLKPTYGRVSRYGLVAFASSLDQIGPLTQTVEDSAILLNAISGFDTNDCTSSQQDVQDFTAKLNDGIEGKIIGIPEEYFSTGLEDNIRTSIEDSLAELEKQGAKLQKVNLPSMPYAISSYYIIATAEASSNLSRFDGVRYTHRSPDAKNLFDLYAKSRAEGFGEEVKRRILLGTYVLSSGYYDAYYVQAQKVRNVITSDFNKAFEKCDVIAAPTLPANPMKLGEGSQDPMAMYLSDIYTVSLNLAGLPGISVPCGVSQNLKVGMQLIGKAFGEAELLQTAAAVEKAADEKSAALA